MRRVHVEQGEIKDASSNDQPMRWAVLQSSGAAIYVGMLGPDQNGNACDCKCPACGEVLQAVNAGKPASHFLKENTLGQFFRHPSGHQRKDCSFLVAKLAALHLLMERGEIDLPPPRRTGVQHGISGTTYNEIAEGRRWRGRITDKVWLDNQSARITLDGRTVLVQLQARTGLSSEEFDGVITISVNDPVVASWTPDQILDALKLDSDFSCWDKHWDDEELEADARRKALALADEAMDCLPPELGALDGLTNFQKSETILHAKVKDILGQAGGLRAPSCNQPVSRVMCDGSQKSRPAHIDGHYLTLSDVRLESPMPGMVPDVVCTARSSRNPSESFTLLIEVAVTHRVDAAKKAKIAARNLACIEIDLTRLGALQRRVTIDQLRTEVIEATDCKNWIFNPALARLVKSKTQELEREDRDMRLAIQREEDRLEWLDDCSTERLIELLLPALQHYWLTEEPMQTDEDYEVLPEEIAERLVTRGFKSASDRQLLKKDGVLSCIEDIRSRHLTQRSAGKYGGLWNFDNDPKLRSYVTLGLMAAKAYPLNLSPDDQNRYNELRQRVTESVDSEKVEYVRPTAHDELIARLFPAMRDLLAKPFGTQPAHRAKQELKWEKKRQEDQEKARVEAERNKKMIEEWERKRKVIALLSVERVDAWTQSMSVKTIETVLKKTGVVRLIGNYARSGMDVESLLKSAWEARSRGAPFRTWFSDLQVQDTGKAKMILEALKTAGLLS
jgi:hypothetical protein